MASIAIFERTVNNYPHVLEIAGAHNKIMSNRKKRNEAGANAKTSEQFEKDLPKRISASLEGRRPIGDASNALSLLFGYVITRLGVPKEASNLDRRLNRTTIDGHRKDFLEGRHVLSDDDEDLLRDFLKIVLEDGSRSFELDYNLLEPLFAAAGVPFTPSVRDYRNADLQFMRAMNIDVDDTPLRVPTIEQGHQKLFAKAGGIWIVLRTNSHGTGAFNISVLDIKPQTYFSHRTTQDPRFVRSLGLHFSMRSREVAHGFSTVMTFRGRVMPDSPTSVTLMGGRSSDLVRPVTLSLAWLPSGDGDINGNHIPEVFGLTTTVNSEGDMVSAPVVGFFVPEALYPGDLTFQTLTHSKSAADELFDSLPKLPGGRCELPDVFGRDADRQRSHVYAAMWYQQILQGLESIVLEVPRDDLAGEVKVQLENFAKESEVGALAFKADTIASIVAGIGKHISHLDQIKKNEKDQGYFKARALYAKR